jgi:hypothetical protein
LPPPWWPRRRWRWPAWFDASQARQIATRGSLSGAAVGGALFGTGMILARGCSSRLLVLAAQGNLRSVMSGLVFAVTAQAAWTGALAPWREAISGWWTVDGGAARDLIARTGIGHGGALLFGAVWLLAAVWWARRQKVPAWGWAGAMGVGLSIAAAWWATYAFSQVAFDPHPIQALSFTGPSAEVLTRVLFASDKPPTFDLGLMPGVFIGSFWPLRCFASSSSKVLKVAPACAATLRAPCAWALAACWPGAAPWVRACRARRCSPSRAGSRCVPSGLRRR